MSTKTKLNVIVAFTGIFTLVAFATLLPSSAKNDNDKIPEGYILKKIPAPPLTVLQWVQGPETQVSTGQVTIIEFWATWCPPCVKTVPHLNDLYVKHKDAGLRIAALTDEPQIKVAPFIAKQKGKMTYPVAICAKDYYAKYLQSWGIDSIPHTFIVGADGDYFWHGYPLDPEFEKAVEKALANMPAKR